MPEATIHQFIVARRGWIQKHQARLAALPPPSARLYATGETHYYQGRPHQLHVLPAAGRPRVVLHADMARLELHVPPGSTPQERELVLLAWYRARLKEQLPQLLARWEPVVGARASAWSVKQMKTRWGTCNTRTGRIWLNLELIKKPLPCLEYVLVHELVHLHERLHNARFWGFMDQFMPDWRQHKAALNQAAPGATEPLPPDAC
jgi:predicted metal-dependent hydrolase